MALAGLHNSVNERGIVAIRTSPRDLEMSLKIKRERREKHQFTPQARVESIVFEVAKHSPYDANDAYILGRHLWWPQPGPLIALTLPEEDLIFAEPWRIEKDSEGFHCLAEKPDPRHIVENPYGVDQHGHATREKPLEGPKLKQRLADIADGRVGVGSFGEFLLIHPVAQIISLPCGAARWMTMGTHRMPLTALSGFDDRKMAVLVNPFTGEAFFTGGRYQIDFKG